MKWFLLGYIIGEIVSWYISPIIRALGENILLRIERRKNYILEDINVIKEEMEEEKKQEEHRIIGFSTEEGDYTNGGEEGE